ncbi:helix-turn-helix transcriptional regulator [Gluconacetobacter tumulisoli]|uniref:Helix-turn-helix transcriptional regulator n=1 Tax=Gluconacetobacter tumulisoli TaxID=1286189 RepID=A0A7W4K819_9PROT|nr:helix-turn-helix transcriptional regulator [Gluconacetobacter tumulisoli]MBB2202071.1 helix-turn-helix transcriptional regulator [Gluconacetobacter tumulisoli]
MNHIVPIFETPETITLNRADWEVILDRLDDRNDLDAIRRSEQANARTHAYTDAETHRMMLEDVSALTIWRERAGLTQKALADMAGVSQSYVNEIEGGKKPGSAATLAKLAATLGASVDRLLD